MKAGFRAFIVLGLAILVLSWNPNPGPHAAEFGDTPCWFADGGDDQAWCGKLIVPVRHEAPNGPLLTLPVVILPRPAEEEAREPIVILTGGPGGSAFISTAEEIDYWRNWAMNLPKGHNLIIFDQRGAGLSKPSLSCPELADPLIWAPASLVSGQQEDPLPAYQKALERCRDELLAQGNDLGAYNSKQIALDVVALRKALGIERWILFGYSYGTTLALTVLRHDEAAVHAMILDGVSPPENDDRAGLLPHYDRALKRIFSDCAASPVCSPAYPELESQFRRVLETLAAEPIEISLNDWSRERKIFVEVNDSEFLAVLYWAMYDRINIPGLPRMISSAAEGDYFDFRTLASSYYLSSYWSLESTGMNWSVYCNEVFPFDDRNKVGTEADRHPHLARWLASDNVSTTCDSWPSGRADPAFKDPVASEVPTLLLAGAYDPRTPLPLAEMAAQHLTNGQVFELPSASHGVTVEAGCAFRVIAQFLDRRFARPEPQCLSWQAPAAFEVSYQ